MNWEEVYKKETGNDASYTKTDEWHAWRTHDWYYDEYVDWLESKLTTASQQSDSADAQCRCAFRRDHELKSEPTCLQCGKPVRC